MQPILMDLNLTEDFAAGFLLAARSPELNILGITVTFGETDLATAVRNTAELADLCGLTALCPWARSAPGGGPGPSCPAHAPGRRHQRPSAGPGGPGKTDPVPPSGSCMRRCRPRRSR